jgi:putative ATP-grasp target RiPP
VFIRSCLARGWCAWSHRLMTIAFTQPTGSDPLLPSTALRPLSDTGGGSQTTRFASDPVASASGQFALCRPTVDVPVAEVPAETGVRPWGLRAMTAARPTDSRLPTFRYDHVRQVAVLEDGSGRRLVDAVAGPPTAQNVDGEDPPSSEDWKNDFAPDDPCPC